jgi:predicted transposase YbfD/YdcC
LSQEGEHGRLDGRRAAVAAISPVTAGLPGARSAITVQRDWTEKKDPLQTRKSHTRCFLSSLAVRVKARATGGVRGHWSVENRNHHKRDASAWQEDRHRHRKPNAALNLALTRNVLLAIIPFEEGQPLAHFFEQYHRHPHHALRLILNARPVL